EMAIPTARATAIEGGYATQEPAFGLQALWLPSDRVDVARTSGYTVVDSLNVLGTHFTELVKRYAWEIFSRQDAKSFCDRVAAEHPKAVEDLTPKLLSMAGIQRVLQHLLREGVSIRDGLTIVEALGEASATTKNPVLLTEFVRQALRRSLLKPLLSPSGELRAWFLDATLEHAIESTVQHGELNSIAAVSPQIAHDLLAKLQASIDRTDSSAVLIAGAGIRFFVRQMIEHSMPNLHVISHNEIPNGVRVQSLGLIR
ncbi:MAG TPA: FHIPEP family type III secretion protein, partial [Bryobacteraceae bacterium]|nr:FHIPEP family type III secretion protein [Bryobacteraceae bacterium]